MSPQMNANKNKAFVIVRHGRTNKTLALICGLISFDHKRPRKIAGVFEFRFFQQTSLHILLPGLRLQLAAFLLTDCR